MNLSSSFYDAGRSFGQLRNLRRARAQLKQFVIRAGNAQDGRKKSKEILKPFTVCKLILSAKTRNLEPKPQKRKKKLSRDGQSR